MSVLWLHCSRRHSQTTAFKAKYIVDVWSSQTIFAHGVGMQGLNVGENWVGSLKTRMKLWRVKPSALSLENSHFLLGSSAHVYTCANFYQRIYSLSLENCLLATNDPITVSKALYSLKWHVQKMDSNSNRQKRKGCFKKWNVQFCNFFFVFYSEHSSLSDHKGSGGQRWTDCIFSLHCQWTEEGQLPPVASGDRRF